MSKKSNAPNPEAPEEPIVTAAEQEPVMEQQAVPEPEAAELSPEELLLQAQQLAEQLAQEKLELETQHLRLQADFDNFRKRSRQEREEFVKQAGARLISELLPVLDNFERALAALPEDAGREGVQLIERQLMDVLSNHGLSRIDCVGECFDPQIHEAVLQTECGEENKGKVIAEAQKGYLLHGKLLRPSMVQIGG